MIRMKILGTPRLRNAASSRIHGVVSVSSTTREIDTATRLTTRAAASRPWAVKPWGVPFQYHRVSTTSPEVISERVAGRTTIPVKIGTNNQTRLTKNPTGRADAAARTRVIPYSTHNVIIEWD